MHVIQTIPVLVTKYKKDFNVINATVNRFAKSTDNLTCQQYIIHQVEENTRQS